MPDPRESLDIGELGHFYDVIHGRVAFEELPLGFHSALKMALSSKALDRLKRISQLGHTAVSFFSATHTRFSHAIGTMLVMNKLFLQTCNSQSHIEIFAEVEKFYPKFSSPFSDTRDMVRCHLLLAALYQDVGELPFQKVTSLFFSPIMSAVQELMNDFSKAAPKLWKTKRVFSMLALVHDLKDSKLNDQYNLDFLCFLMTGDGLPKGANKLRALTQMVDGVIDADRLDYVYRDASVTIGSLSSPGAVVDSVVAYDVGKVIVNDPRPVTDFLSTRMRLFTFVYSAADVRFMQVLLKTVLDGRWDNRDAEKAFSDVNLSPVLKYKDFMALDDSSLMERLGRLEMEYLKPFRKNANALLQGGTLDYTCRVMKRPELNPSIVSTDVLPNDLFFDLLSDHGNHQLYLPQSIFVRQGLTSRIGEEVPLEESAGAFSPLFAGKNSAILVANGYYLFQPRKPNSSRWTEVFDSISKGELYYRLAWENANRDLACPTDTRNLSSFQDFDAGKSISISYCAIDFPEVIRVVRELYRLKRRYVIILRPYDGTGNTPEGNSTEVIRNAEAVIALVSKDYLMKAKVGSTCINIEVNQMHTMSGVIPIVPLGIDERKVLDSVKSWDWGEMNEAWRRKKAVIPDGECLRMASDESLREAVQRAIDSIEAWKGVA
jgi:HD superfamily phosphohydrolase